MTIQIRSYRLNNAEDFLNSLDFMKHFLLEKYHSNPTDHYAGDTLKAFNYVLLMIFDIKNAIEIEKNKDNPQVHLTFDEMRQHISMEKPDAA